MTEGTTLETVAEAPRRPAKRGLPVSEQIALWRAKYADALVCTACGRLLASRRESYARSGLTEADRLAFVCAECRQDAAQAEALAEVRRANLRLANASKNAGRGALHGLMQDTPPGVNPDAVLRGGFSDVEHVEHPLAAAQRRLGRHGRPRVPVAEQRERRRERDRCRRGSPSAPSNFLALVGEPEAVGAR